MEIAPPVLPSPQQAVRRPLPHGLTRWLVLAAGTILQLSLGTIYAWSYFQQPLMKAYGWQNYQVSWAFSVAIGCLGLTAATAGWLLPRFGPRKLAVGGGVLFGLGYLLAAAALREGSLPLFYLGYGFVGGCGLGLGYVTPVATVARWFPDKKGLATGIVIMGFGFGALLLSTCLAPWLMHVTGADLVRVFAWLGVALGGTSALAALALHNPPGATAGSSSSAAPTVAQADRVTPGAAVFCLMWAVFFCNIIAGISLISFLSPLFQDLWKSLQPRLSPATLASYGGTLIAVGSVFNGVGRMFWGGVSDRLGRLATFRLMLASQIIAFALLAVTRQPWLFGGLLCYILLCYGGGFGTMPAFVLDTFGPRRMAGAYGAMLTAWSVAGVVGPQLVALLKDRGGAAAAKYSFMAAAAFVTVGLLLALAMRDPGREPHRGEACMGSPSARGQVSS